MSDPGRQGYDAYLINLDSDTDRLAHMQGECARAGIAVSRFPALGPHPLPDDLHPMFLDPQGAPHAPLTPGEIGCYASHLALMRRIGAGARPGLVMEDDLRLSPDFAGLDALIAAAPPDWAFLRLSNSPKSPCFARARAGRTWLVEYWRVPNNAGAYLVSPAGARRFLAAHPRRLRPIDEDLRRVWEHGCVTYGALPPPALSNIFDSSIEAAGARGDAPARMRFAAARRRLGGVAPWRWRLRRLGALDCARALAHGLWLRLRRIAAGRRASPAAHMLRPTGKSPAP